MSDDAGLTWGVGAVATRLDIAASTLRTWERRYGVGPSHRTQGGHRRYTERDIERVELVRRLVGRGVSAQDAARVARNLDRDELAAALAESPSAAQLETESPVDALLTAALTVDETRLDDLVTRLVRRSTFLDTWSGVLSPFLARVATEQVIGTLSTDGEQLAIDVVLRALERRRPQHDRVPEVVLASRWPAAESIPLVAVDTALRAADVRTQHVGPDGLEARVGALLAAMPAPTVLVLWSDHEEPWLPHDSTAALAVLRAAPAWPRELRFGAGREGAMVPGDVAALVGAVLDRAT